MQYIAYSFNNATYEILSIHLVHIGSFFCIVQKLWISKTCIYLINCMYFDCLSYFLFSRIWTFWKVQVCSIMYRVRLVCQLHVDKYQYKYGQIESFCTRYFYLNCYTTWFVNNGAIANRWNPMRRLPCFLPIQFYYRRI